MSTEQIAPIAGAAIYRADKCNVWMLTTEGHTSIVQSCRTYELAKKAAVRWQKKENKAVLNSQKKLK